MVSNIQWRLILFLSLFGVAMGAFSVMGFTGGAEPFLWPIIAIFCAIVIGTKTNRTFANGLFTGLLVGGIAPLIQAVFFHTYISNNAAAAAQLKQLPPGLSPRLIFFIQVPLIGLISGMVLGLLSWIVGKVVARKDGVAPVN
jgi:hypothetical protein